MCLVYFEEWNAAVFRRDFQDFTLVLLHDLKYVLKEVYFIKYVLVCVKSADGMNAEVLTRAIGLEH